MSTRLTAVAVVAAAALLAPATPAVALDTVDTSQLRAAVTVAGILRHERDLQHLANTHGGARLSGTAGYDVAASYVAQELKAAGYTVHRQRFSFPYFAERAPATFAQISPSAETFNPSTFAYSGSGDVTGPLVLAKHIGVRPPVGPTGTSGCAASDFTTPPNGSSVVLVQRGTCSYQTKADLAAAAGYAAVVVFDDLDSGTAPLIGSLDHETDIPVLSIGYEAGDELVARVREHTAVTVHLTASTVVEQRTTTNVWAALAKGTSGRLIVVGAHLDTVAPQPPLNRSPEGAPGINGNGSGVSTVLEIATQLRQLGYAKKGRLKRQVRFVFFGAEEPGRYGSRYYVDHLSPSRLASVDAYLNVDTLGSLNYQRYVSDGDGSAGNTPGPAGSAAIEQAFTDYFADQGLTTVATPLDQTSDDASFAAAGIPVGGVTSGRRGIDDCYHLACDDIRNLDPLALAELGDAVANETLVLASSASGVLPNRVAPTGAVHRTTVSGPSPRS